MPCVLPTKLPGHIVITRDAVNEVTQQLKRERVV